MLSRFTAPLGIWVIMLMSFLYVSGYELHAHQSSDLSYVSDEVKKHHQLNSEAIQYDVRTAPANVSKESSTNTGYRAENHRSASVALDDQIVLDIDFEKGEGVPEDHSDFNHDIEVIGDTAYISDALEGAWAYELEENSDLAIRNASALSSEEITVDLWFKATESPSDSARLVAKQAGADSSAVNYSLFFDDGFLKARAKGAGTLRLDNKIQVGQWYRAVYMISPSAHSLQLWNLDGELVTHAVEQATGTPATGDGPLYLGQGSFYPDSAFNGFIDQVQIHNYPSETGPFVVKNISKYISVADTVPEYPIEAVIPHAGKGEVDARLYYRGQFGWTFLKMDLVDPETGTYSKPITSQNSKTLVPYYVEIEEGPYKKTIPEGATSSMDTPHFDIAVYTPNTQVLDLGFEHFREDTSLNIPVDQSAYSEFAESHLRGPSRTELPTVSDKAIEGNHSMRFVRQNRHSLEIFSDFLATDEITVSMWFKIDEFDPELGETDSLPRHNSTVLLGKHTDHSPWNVFNDYGFLIRNQAHHPDGIRRTLFPVSWSEHANNFDITTDSTLAADKWYHLHYEYSKNDTAFVQLSTRNDTLIQENGINTEGYGALAKSSTPLSIGNAYLDADCSNCTYFSGWIDNVDIYNYAATANPPKVTVFPIDDSVSVPEDDPTVEARVTRNGDEEVILRYRYITDTDTTDYSTKALDPDHTGNNYSGTLPLPETAGVVIQYGVATSNDFGEEIYEGPYTTLVLPHAYDYYINTKLRLNFESGGGEIEDHSPYQWTVKKKGFQDVPTFSNDAKWGDYSMRFSSRDSSFLEITPPYPFLNQKSFVIQVLFKSFHNERNKEINNAGVHLIHKQGGAGKYPWHQGNFKMKGIGCNSWTFGGYLREQDVDERFISNHLDDPEHLGYTKGDCSDAPALEDSTWYIAKYYQDVKYDSIYVEFSDAEGNIVANTSLQIPGDEQRGTVWTQGPFRIGRSGNLPKDTGQKNFNGLVDHITIYPYPREVDDIPGDNQSEFPKEIHLGKNYPNPFNPTTQIDYSLPQVSDVKLTVYDVLGRHIATLVDGKRQAGQHSVTFDAGKLSSGVYIYRLKAGEYRESKKMLLMK